MANSIDSAKPAKPYQKFPLFPHATRRWAKKINGKLYYFGPWDDWKAALAKYESQADYLHSGLTPPVTPDGLTVARAVNEFLNAKRQLVDNGELSARSWLDYKGTSARIVKVFQGFRQVEDLRPDDFLRLRAELAKGRGPVSLGNEIQRCRSIFKYAYDQEHIRSPVRFGQGFAKPSRKTLRKQRAKNRSVNGYRVFTADQLRRLLAIAHAPLRAMILLGINCGFGQTDIANLPIDAIDLENGWIDFPRPKTGADRRCPLWPSTVLALREWLPRRPKPKDEADSNLAFVTKYGSRWVKVNEVTGSPDDAVSKEFNKLLCAEKMKRRGLAFYALRHTFRTVADESLDQVAVRIVMGHIDASIDDHYREHVADARLRRVADHVHEWLYPAPSVIRE